MRRDHVIAESFAEEVSNAFSHAPSVDKHERRLAR